ncbi:Mov34/MPN/PAD-1 family protein [Paenibacillus allorhizosphaerae]|uniref:MPN domain-containing protein n=1 Tax=Paenibacillus allorhizosphaerae TaxID=2849866 RepID=A0ABN7TQ47_9BACL|nr:M67 family metallopeptidase [Paenibacillus allorhizosphaerae]CAG7650839.1 hypothetical protein PAECIP111802_04819 [Paenibacillus allorhizosphaerae]
MLLINNRAYRDMIDYCMKQRPHEACGFLSGYRGDCSGPNRIGRFIPVANRSPRPELHFDMEPHEVVRALYEMEADDLVLLGIVHSHPQAPPVPSAEDMLTPWRQAISHWIVSLHGDVASTKAYAYSKLDDGTLTWSELPIVITP